MSIAFVIGNGTSRKPVVLDKLKSHGTVYACNAVYREFSPDYLIAVDPKMVMEICNQGYQLKNKVWTNPNKRYASFEKLNYFDPSKGWSSGPTALWLASQQKYQKIYILGFDYKGLQDGKKVNNIYAGTKNYKAADAKATYYGNWLRQTMIVMKENPNIEYIRVIPNNAFEAKELLQPNSSTENIYDFIKRYQCN